MQKSRLLRQNRSDLREILTLYMVYKQKQAPKGIFSIRLLLFPKSGFLHLLTYSVPNGLICNSKTFNTSVWKNAISSPNISRPSTYFDTRYGFRPGTQPQRNFCCNIFSFPKIGFFRTFSVWPMLIHRAYLKSAKISITLPK